MDVSIIIVNYKTSGLVVDCIDSVIAKTEDLAYEIIVVDNNSDDGLDSLLRSRYADNVRCLMLSENIGFGRANNEGIGIARGRNILFLNPDTVLINNAVKILSDFIDATPEAGGCGGNMFDPDMRPAHSFKRVFPSVLSYINDIFGGILLRMRYGRNIYFNHGNRPVKVAHIVGADLMISRRTLDEAGMFDPSFFMYYEETELAYRIRKNTGKRMYSVPSARIIHLEGKSFEIKEHRMRMIETSRRNFNRIVYTGFKCKLLNSLFFIMIISRICLGVILFDRQKLRYWKTQYKIFKEHK